MNPLIPLLDSETEKWAAKSYETLRSELEEPVCLQRDGGSRFHQVEIELLEQTRDYVHISVSIDDGQFLSALKPLSRDFLVYRQGRVDW